MSLGIDTFVGFCNSKTVWSCIIHVPGSASLGLDVERALKTLLGKLKLIRQRLQMLERLFIRRVYCDAKTDRETAKRFHATFALNLFVFTR